MRPIRNNTFSAIRLTTATGVLAALIGGCGGDSPSFAAEQSKFVLEFVCSGTTCLNPPTCNAFGPMALVGEEQFQSDPFGSTTSTIAATAININNGSVVVSASQCPSSAVITNGTAGPDATGGNGIPKGCFTVAIDLSNCGGGSAHTFGCYAADGAHADEVFTDANGGTATCVDTKVGTIPK